MTTRTLLGRGMRFSFAGAICTLVGGIVFVVSARFVHYQAANVASWASGVALGFAMNRRFTYGIIGPEALNAQLAIFFIGSLGQLALSSLGYALLIGRFHLAPVVAFIMNLIFTATYMFAYLELLTFRRRGAASR